MEGPLESRRAPHDLVPGLFPGTFERRRAFRQQVARQEALRQIGVEPGQEGRGEKVVVDYVAAAQQKRLRGNRSTLAVSRGLLPRRREVVQQAAVDDGAETAAGDAADRKDLPVETGMGRFELAQYLCRPIGGAAGTAGGRDKHERRGFRPFGADLVPPPVKGVLERCRMPNRRAVRAAQQMVVAPADDAEEDGQNDDDRRYRQAQQLRPAPPAETCREIPRPPPRK